MAKKLKIDYRPESGSKREWTIDLKDPVWDVWAIAPKEVGCGWATFANRLQDVDGLAWRALIWVLRKRDEPRLEIDSIELRMSQLDFDVVDEPEPDESTDADPEA